MKYLLDGASGTTLWKMAEREGIAPVPVWRYNIEHPELVLELDKRYVAAGSNFIQTNTFDANRLSVQRSSSYSVEEVVKRGVEIALEAVEGTSARPFFSVGPLAELLRPYGLLKPEVCREIYEEQIGAGAKVGGIDTIVLETFTDVNMMEIAAKVAKDMGFKVICSMSFHKRRRTLMGDTIKHICEVLEPIGLEAIGMNCSNGPLDSFDIIQEYHDTTSLPLFYKPNSGMGEKYDANQFVEEITPALDLVTYVGGCCGTDFSYIEALKKVL